MDLKKKMFILLLSNLSFAAICKGQMNGCIDSVTFNQFFPSNFSAPSTVGGTFLYAPQRDSFDNVYISGYTDVGPSAYWSTLKFNSSNQLLWYKNYRTLPGGQFLGGGNLHDIESNGNLFFSEDKTNPFSKVISKTDKDGNLLWSKRIQHANPTLSGGFELPVLDSYGEFYSVGKFNSDAERPVVIAFDALGNLKWVKRYQHISVPKFHLIEVNITSQDANTIVLAMQYFYDADVVTDPTAKFGMQLAKIDKTNGSIVQQNSFMYYNDALANTPNRAQFLKIRYSNISKTFILDFDQSGFGISKRMFSLLDDDLNLLKTIYLSSFPKIVTSVTKVTIGKDNVITIINPIQTGSSKKLLYAALDNNLNIINQRAINLGSIGFPNRNYQADLTYKKNGILNFQLATNTSFLPDYLFLFDHSPFYNTISPCLGIDSVIYNPVPIYVYPITNPTIEEAGTVQLQSTDLVPDFPPVDFTIPKTEVCKQVSICDNIKLFGTKYHCMSNPLDSFKIYRNPLCKRKTNWQVDTSYIKILSQNDTALYVEYRQSYRGKIKVSFGGCSLTDSIAIEVYNAKTGVNLGNDTMHCPGKTITLKAGKGFKTYKWQNNSTLDSLVATQPGTYHIIATDSCGNIFKDSIIIAPFDVVLKTDYPGRLCPADTVTFNLPDSLYNYSWLPTGNSSLNNYVWRLYPTATTTYSITGERRSGCIISDTVLINVKPNCLPDYIYFPTGFTPNGDTRNELYKPSINGQLTLYEFTIFNRYGQPIFKTNNTTAGWDGRFKNSKNPLTGSYVWICKYQFVGRPLQQEQGSFVLIR